MKKADIICTLLAFALIFTPTADIYAQGSLVCGAYIEQNAKYADSIEEYEELCGAENNIYLINVRSEYPYVKVLQCYAAGKTPMLLLSDKYNMGKVAQLAEQAGEYNLPMYLCISGGDLVFYRYCVGMFRLAAPNVKFVQAVNMSDYDYAFAGADVVDYLAINATIGAKNKNYPYLYNMIQNADVPVMLNLAVSRYDGRDHSYHTYEAMKTLKYIYDMKEGMGDKLFGINYVNVEYKGQKYDVYSDEKLRVVYGGAVCEWGNKKFLNNF
ncbi:MAG: hypothetical protein IJR45_04130 [Firmicutes bacterium]|nr:hypothetical protein [Bacillota bacterium]